MSKKLKPIPNFANEDDEREFWATHDTVDYVDWSNAIRNPVFKNLKRSDNIFEVSIPPSEVEPLTKVAAKYQLSNIALLHKFILDGLRREQGLS